MSSNNPNDANGVDEMEEMLMDCSEESEPDTTGNPTQLLGKRVASSDISPGAVKKAKLTNDGGDDDDKTQVDAMNGEDGEDDEDNELIENGYVPPGLKNYTSSSFSFVDQEAPKYNILGESEVANMMNDHVASTKSTLKLPTEITRALLNHFGWDGVKLYETYFAGGDAELAQLFVRARLEKPVPQEAVPASSLVAAKGEDEVEEDCQICGESVSPSDMYGMACGHRCCINCWTHYASQLVTEGSALRISCIAPDCNYLLDDERLKKFLNDPSLEAKYQKQWVNNFVQSNETIKWCPGPDCKLAVKVGIILQNEDIGITCKCGKKFCFQCTGEDHSPISCEMLKVWVNLLEKDVESTNWISANTKACPRCHAHIQKNGGCNFMMCSKCGYMFCWFCLQSHNHGFHICNRFTENKGEGSQSKVPVARYKFCLDRYKGHQLSFKFEKELCQTVKKIVATAEAQTGAKIDPHFLRVVFEAIETLSRCRQTLIYCCVFTFFVEKSKENSHVELFEMNMDSLHNAVEKLSGLLEHEMDPLEDLEEKIWKLAGMKYSCGRRCEALISHVREGREKNWWKLQGY